MEKTRNPFKRPERSKRTSLVEKAVEKLSVSDVSQTPRPAADTPPREAPLRDAAPRQAPPPQTHSPQAQPPQSAPRQAPQGGHGVVTAESATAQVHDTVPAAMASAGGDVDTLAPPVETRPAPQSESGDGDGRAEPKRVKLDLERMRSVGMVTSHSERTLIAEEFRLVKRPLLMKAFAKGPEAVPRGNLIMVASSRPGEGKTFCSISLAMSIASERDLTVLLIDADVAKPDIPNSMGFESGKGLVDVLADTSMDLSDVMLKTDLDNLTIVPAGTSHHLATELLASDRMAHLVEDIALRYPDRIIILDSPPALMSSVAGVLAIHVGQILFVVEADRTTEAALDNALGLVSACKSISLLLNKSRSLGGTERFGSYNYGNYGY